MEYLSRVGGRRVLLALGAFYVAVAAAVLGSQVGGGLAAGELLIPSLLIGASGLAFLYGGYRLPESSVRPDLYGVVTGWCLRATSVMLAIVVLGLVAGNVDDFVSGFLVLPALAGVAGLGMGIHDARARTRALDAEERRREAERYSRELERYRTIVETVNDGIFVVDEEGNFTLVNEAYTKLVGYDREELLGSPASHVAAGETDVESMSEEIERDLTEGTAETKTYESTVKTVSGESIEVESAVAPIPEQEGGHDKAVVVRDVTERNERERELERQNERLESFASMLAHELRNPVTIGQIYGRQLPADENPEAVEYVTEAFDRIENIIDVMLVITRGRKAVSESAPVDLADAAREAWTEVDAADATLDVTTDRTVEADETYVRHLFRNLFDNAIEHGSTSNHPTDDDAVEHGSRSSRSQSPDVIGDGTGGVTVTVGALPTGFYVADDGTGIPADEREAVFGTGYTTASGQGRMGLGLTFVREMADVYDWECSLTESEDGGARFEFENVAAARTDAN